MNISPIEQHEESGATHPRRSLRTKLLLSVAALIVAPGVLFGVIVQQSIETSLRRVMGAQLGREASHTSERLAALLSSERQALASLAQQDLMRELRVGDIDKRIALSLTTLRDGSPVRVDYLAVDLAGAVVASSNPAYIGEGPEWASSLLGEAVADAQRRGPMSFEGEANEVILDATSIPDPDAPEQSIGVLLGIYDWSEMTRATAILQLALAEQGLPTHVLVVDSAGKVLGGTPDPSAQLPLPALPGVSVSRAAVSVVEHAGFLLARAELGPSETRWQIVIAEPLSAALAPARELGRRLLVALALTLAVALVFAAIAGHRVVEPLRELTRAIRGIAIDETHSLRVEIRAEDEVGELAHAFNHMASELGRAQKDLSDAAKYAFVGELAGGVAHEVRTSLGVLRGSAQILERLLPAHGNERSEEGERAVELAGLIRAEVDRLGGVVNDLLSLARPRETQLEAVPIDEMLGRAADLVEAQARGQGTEIVRCASVERGAGGGADSQELVALGDRDLLYQVALNLLVNAMQVLESGGRIEINSYRAADGHVGFEIVDDGPGIPDEIREKIFLPFVTAREGGVGLGLTFVRQVMHEHRGRVLVEDIEPKGTRFRIEMPSAQGLS